MSGFIFDKLFTEIKEQSGIDLTSTTAAKTDAQEDVDQACFYMGVDNVEAKVTCDVLNVRETRRSKNRALVSCTEVQRFALRAFATIGLASICRARRAMSAANTPISMRPWRRSRRRLSTCAKVLRSIPIKLVLFPMGQKSKSSARRGAGLKCSTANNLVM